MERLEKKRVWLGVKQRRSYWDGKHWRMGWGQGETQLAKHFPIKGPKCNPQNPSTKAMLVSQHWEGGDRWIPETV